MKTLKDIRLSLGLNQAEMAFHIGIPVSTYSAYERGTKKIPLRLVGHLHFAYGVQLQQWQPRAPRRVTMTKAIKEQINAAKDKFANRQYKIAARHLLFAADKLFIDIFGESVVNWTRANELLPPNKLEEVVE